MSSSIQLLASDTVVHTRRKLEHIRQVPERLADVTFQPVMFVVLFAYVFGGVIAIPGGGSYKEYLIGGVMVQSLAFGMFGPGMSIANDLKEGVIERFRSLPSSNSSYLVGHLLAELATTALAVTIMSITGLCIGWRIHSNPQEAVLGFAMLGLFGMAMIWLGTLIGLSVRSSDAVQGIGFVVVFPMTFVATTFVPLDGFSPFLKHVAAWNPVSAMANATRELFGNPTGIVGDAPWPMEHAVLTSFLWIALIMAVSIPLAIRMFARRTRG
jgi:ABC-type multidrug transport system permease subunit